ncbi:hypothetical protein BC831DRAFT_92568 [Entophlyctis helioformis]|nr:hypothetical protein BC831DRAFT_92568 [Entophlyctis helioformis]
MANAPERTERISLRPQPRKRIEQESDADSLASATSSSSSDDDADDNDEPLSSKSTTPPLVTSLSAMDSAAMKRSSRGPVDSGTDFNAVPDVANEADDEDDDAGVSPVPAVSIAKAPAAAAPVVVQTPAAPAAGSTRAHVTISASTTPVTSPKPPSLGDPFSLMGDSGLSLTDSLYLDSAASKSNTASPRPSSTSLPSTSLGGSLSDSLGASLSDSLSFSFAALNAIKEEEEDDSTARKAATIQRPTAAPAPATTVTVKRYNTVKLPSSSSSSSTYAPSPLSMSGNTSSSTSRYSSTARSDLGISLGGDASPTSGNRRANNALPKLDLDFSMADEIMAGFGGSSSNTANTATGFGSNPTGLGNVNKSMPMPPKSAVLPPIKGGTIDTVDMPAMPNSAIVHDRRASVAHTDMQRSGKSSGWARFFGGGGGGSKRQDMGNTARAGQQGGYVPTAYHQQSYTNAGMSTSTASNASALSRASLAGRTGPAAPAKRSGSIWSILTGKK